MNVFKDVERFVDMCCHVLPFCLQVEPASAKVADEKTAPATGKAQSTSKTATMPMDAQANTAPAVAKGQVKATQDISGTSRDIHAQHIPTYAIPSHSDNI